MKFCGKETEPCEHESVVNQCSRPPGHEEKDHKGCAHWCIQCQLEASMAQREDVETDGGGESADNGGKPTKRSGPGRPSSRSSKG